MSAHYLIKKYFYHILLCWIRNTLTVIFVCMKNRRKGVIVGNDQDGDDTIVVAQVCKCCTLSLVAFNFFFFNSVMTAYVCYIINIDLLEFDI